MKEIVIRYFIIADWFLTANKTECEGTEEYMGVISTVDECSKRCKEKSSMFIFGTNDYGTTRCFSKGCNCLCETAASSKGICSQIRHDGYRLYKYTNDGKVQFV